MTGIVVVQLLLPLLLLVWLVLGRPRTRSTWALRVLTVGGVLLALAYAGVWLALPAVVLWVLLLTFPVAALANLARLRPRTGGAGPGGGPRTALLAGLALLGSGMAGMTILWRTPPEGASIDLLFPLRGGSYYVANGGRSPFLNAHLAIPDSGLSLYRGQLQGVDLVRVDRLGRRARGILPRDPSAYLSFGDTVFAPCSGRVVATLGSLPDRSPPMADREHMAGNHVILGCPTPRDRGVGGGEAWVLLGHLQEGSVAVRAGDPVAAGEPVGRVGNSGNTQEPHLHIHAQTPGTAEKPFSGDPLSIFFEGRYLARNDRIRVR